MDIDHNDILLYSMRHILFYGRQEIAVIIMDIRRLEVVVSNCETLVGEHVGD